IGWKNVPVIAVETHGSNAFQASVVAGKLVTLPKISTIASGLAASTVSSKSLELSLVHPVVPFAVSDAMAADAVRLFAAEDTKMIVEAASGAVLSLCYTQLIRDILPSLGQECDVVVLVTGGSDISLSQLDEYRKKFYRPPVIVKSGGEVFLKMDDKLTHIQSVDMSEPLGISSDNLTKINQGHKQKVKESNRQQRLQQQQEQQKLVADTPMEDSFQVSTQEEEEDMLIVNASPSDNTL
ncbi:uncharacterized protein EV154DRAFT_425915, partial [Mucor mucedo]|uniref:uncharacterized protein n=1 Tax=Mucor mucedo TaxID=29922 RepID=UPI00221EC7DF